MGHVLRAELKFDFLYTEIRDLRVISLPWGEQIRLADGRDSPWRLVTEATILAIFFLVAAGCLNLLRGGAEGARGGVRDKHRALLGLLRGPCLSGGYGTPGLTLPVNLWVLDRCAGDGTRSGGSSRR